MRTPLANPFRNCLVAALLAALATACAPPPSVPANGSNLSLEMRRLQAAFDGQEQTLRTLQGQVAELEARLQRQAGEIEELRSKPQTALAPPVPQTTVTVVQPAPTPIRQEGAAMPGQAEGSPTEVYLQAFGDYASGRYQAAIRGFETFLQRFPNNSYAGNAQFWLADCYFNQQQYAQAVQEFERALASYPNAPKSPDALLKIAIAQLQLGAPDQARLAVDTLGKRYPKSTAAQKAQELAIP